jgi:hypothetical protein
VLVAAHRTVVGVVLNCDPNQGHAASPGNGREIAEGERWRGGDKSEVPVQGG